jgi:hypothetical protein
VRSEVRSEAVTLSLISYVPWLLAKCEGTEHSNSPSATFKPVWKYPSFIIYSVLRVSEWPVSTAVELLFNIIITLAEVAETFELVC